MFHNQTLPSRVLEILDPRDVHKGVRLVETRHMKGIYACLSYCWGDSNVGQTVQSNLSNHLQNIPFNDLPSTVMDFIYLCHKLGFKYLWVDRLCIVQDDQGDWSRESSRMCDIYSKSALTISVPLCSKASQSFLSERRKRFWEQSQFRILDDIDVVSGSKHSLGSSSRGSLWISGNLYKTSPWALEKNWTHFCEIQKDEVNPWLRRGWTFQEWILSPRVLHIDKMTIWDCFDGYADELKQRELRRAHLLRNLDHIRICVPWDFIVEEYSQRHLSKEKDRLPALAGLAERYRQVTSYTYLAGLWWEQMPLSLLWQAKVSNSAEGRELADQTIPSWSWAHCNGPVVLYFGSDVSHTVAKPIKYYCRYEPPTSISMVVEAWLEFYGRLSVVTEACLDEHPRVKVGNDWWEFVLDDEGWDQDDAIRERNVKLLLIAKPKSQTEDGRYGALVLHERGSNDGNPSRFRRVGLASLEWSIHVSRQFEEGPLWEKRMIRLV